VALCTWAGMSATSYILNFPPKESPYLVSLVGGGGSKLALLAGRELCQVAVVVALPVQSGQSNMLTARMYGNCTPGAPVSTYILW